MKKIIEGKVYNTERAEMLAEYWNLQLGNDFFGELCSYKEELYVTKKGNYFMYGSGGELSKYSDSNGDHRWGIETIIPLTKREAYEWLEEKNQCEVIEEYFMEYIKEA